jgi:hypothetical protein
VRQDRASRQHHLLCGECFLNVKPTAGIVFVGCDPVCHMHVPFV